MPIIILTYSRKNIRQDFLQKGNYLFRFFFNKEKIAFIILFLSLLFAYWIVPPLNVDSGGYHYIAIRWYEQFKIVPGLANVHGRLAFNPASFIISAAWSLTDLTGQALYPLNGVLVIIFYTWFLHLLFLQKGFLGKLVMFVAVALSLRLTLINISSPSSDLLPGVLLIYCGLRTSELINDNKREFQHYFPVIILSCFAVTAKLSAIPALLLLPFVYFIIIKKRTLATFLKSSLIAILILTPWLLRNFILSGYFLYPVPGTNLIATDWTVPHNVIQLDYIFSKYGPRTVTVDFFTMQKMNIAELAKVWYNYHLKDLFSALLIAVFSLLSVFAWLLFPLFKKKISVYSFLLWCIYYIGVCIWFYNSPEHRFGLPYLILAMVLPFLEITSLYKKEWKISPVFFFLLTIFLCFHYTTSAYKKEAVYPFSLGDCWLLPLKDKRYLPASANPNYLNTFRSVIIGNNVRLYIPSDNHECLNAPGPCMDWPYGEIEMRGTKIEDGFRNKKDEVQKYFPFVSPGKN
ncbi:MAG: hypothetical protein QM726_06745 [Chitinophagaceae bacterium]